MGAVCLDGDIIPVWRRYWIGAGHARGFTPEEHVAIETAIAEGRGTVVPKGTVGVPWPISDHRVGDFLLSWGESSVRILSDADEVGEDG